MALLPDLESAEQAYDRGLNDGIKLALQALHDEDEQECDSVGPIPCIGCTTLEWCRGFGTAEGRIMDLLSTSNHAHAQTHCEPE